MKLAHRLQNLPNIRYYSFLIVCFFHQPVPALAGDILLRFLCSWRLGFVVGDCFDFQKFVGDLVSHLQRHQAAALAGERLVVELEYPQATGQLFSHEALVVVEFEGDVHELSFLVCMRWVIRVGSRSENARPPLSLLP
jgi:hypothetical protein